MFSESLEDNPEVGSSTNKTFGSLINSKPMFRRFLCPPEIFLFKGDPTVKSLISYKPKLFNTLFTSSSISSSDKPPKHN